MGKAFAWLAVAAMIVAGLTAPRPDTAAYAQSSVSVPCASEPAASPMQGHYTGTWHSDGDYQFSVFNTSLDLKVTIDGTIDASVSPAGDVAGKLTGTVNAPITDYGRQDISSGVGTISGNITGVMSASSSLLILSAPVIDMHWGTFGGGHSVERFITMPDYSFSQGSADCISAGGTISETGFPEQNIVADGAGQMTQAPGIGTATGTWQIRSDEADRFSSLSQQVDAFIATANAAIGSPTPLSERALRLQVLAPLRTLQATIAQDPGVARCLLQRLAAWEGSALPALFGRATSLAPSPSLVPIRQSGDLARFAAELNADCGLDDNGTSADIRKAQSAMLDQAISGRDWALAALVAREMLLFGAQPEAVNQTVATRVRALLSSTSTNADTLSVARFAYVAGDAADAQAAFHHVVAHHQRSAFRSEKAKKGGHKKKRAATPRPPTIAQVLMKGIAPIAGTATAGSTPTFQWNAVPSANRYVIFVASSSNHAPLWSWSGTETSTIFGSTAIESTSVASDDDWPISLPTGNYTWSVLALNAAGNIVGMRLPAS